MDRRTLLRGLAMSAALPALDGLSPGELRALAVRAAATPCRVLTPRQAALVAELAEILLPATDTPGATQAGVTGFVDLMLAEQVEAPTREAFLAGLEALDAEATRRHGKPLLECTPAQRYALLDELDARAHAAREAGQPAGDFYPRLKGWTLAGVYASRAAHDAGMVPPLIPGRFDGCVPLPVPPASGAP